MSANTIPISWDPEADKKLFGSLFPQGLAMPNFGTETNNTLQGLQATANRFPQFPQPFNFTTLSTSGIGNKYYKNNSKYNQDGITVYSDDEIPIKTEILDEVKVPNDRFYKEFKDFRFTIFASKNGALLLQQYKECQEDSNEIVLFLEINDATNFFDSVMQIKVGDKVKGMKNLPLTEMLQLIEARKVNLDQKDILELIQKGQYQTKGGVLNWIYKVLTAIVGGATTFVLSGVQLLNKGFISLFDSLLIDDKHWNAEADEYNAFFIPSNITELLKQNNDSKIAKAILEPINQKINGLEKAISGGMQLLIPILPDKVYNKAFDIINERFGEIDAFLTYIGSQDFLNVIKTGTLEILQAANAYLCGFINGIIDFFKGIFEIISIILNAVVSIKDYATDPFYYNSLLLEMFENLLSMIANFDLKQFIINAFTYPFLLLAKTFDFVKNLNISISDININFSKIGYICGYINGLIVAIIVDALLTGGTKAVEDIIKALETFFKNPKAVLKSAFKTIEGKTVATIDNLIAFMSEMATKVKKGATQLWEDFSKFVDDVFKWIEEFLGGEKVIFENNVNLSKKLVSLTKDKTLIQNSNKLDQLYSAAEIANKELKVITTDFALETKGEAGFRNGLKSKERAIEKIESDYAGDTARLVDIAGSKVVYETVGDLYKGLEKFNKEYKILKIKDRIQEPLNGYRDILMNIEAKNGHIVEFRLHLKEMDEVADGIGHKLYEEVRSIKAKAVTENRKLTIDEFNSIIKLEDESLRLYNDAWTKIINK